MTLKPTVMPSPFETALKPLRTKLFRIKRRPFEVGTSSPIGKMGVTTVTIPSLKRNNWICFYGCIRWEISSIPLAIFFTFYRL